MKYKVRQKSVLRFARAKKLEKRMGGSKVKKCNKERDVVGKFGTSCVWAFGKAIQVLRIYDMWRCSHLPLKRWPHFPHSPALTPYKIIRLWHIRNSTCFFKLTEQYRNIAVACNGLVWEMFCKFCQNHKCIHILCTSREQSTFSFQCSHNTIQTLHWNDGYTLILLAMNNKYISVYC